MSLNVLCYLAPTCAQMVLNATYDMVFVVDYSTQSVAKDILNV